MKNAMHFFQASKPACPNPNSITTNLYDLVAAISDLVGVGEERLVADTVLHLIETGRIKFGCRTRVHRRTPGPIALARHTKRLGSKILEAARRNTPC